MVDPRTPVLIGSGQLTHRAAGLDDRRSPISLMAEACERASADAGLGSVLSPDLLAVVATLSFRSADPARLVAKELGVSPRVTGLTKMGGNTPQSLVNTVAASMQRGELDVAVLTGGEARRSQRKAKAAGIEPWADDDDLTPADRSIGEDFVMSSPAEKARQIWMPIQIYPLFETALRNAAGRSPEDHHRHLAQLWSRFAQVATTNPYAWTQRGPSADEICTVNSTNRMVGLPYPKMMNSNNDVDQAAALVMCTVSKARELGVPQDRWVFPLSGTDCHEHPFISNRLSFAETPAIRLGGAMALEMANVGIDDVNIIDLYSCFPSAVQLGAASLGLDINRQLTRTGGLPFAGGPWNNYSMHGIATVMNDLRANATETGLVWANGGFASKHSFGIYRTSPPSAGFRYASPQASISSLPARECVDPAEAAGAATVEAYTVMFDRDGEPERAIASCLLANGRRAWGTSTGEALISEMTVGEWVGRAVTLDQAGSLFA